MTARHVVLTVHRHTNQLGTPFNVQRIHELGDHIENVDNGMVFEHGHCNELQVD
jgi:hypothetical protein